MPFDAQISPTECRAFIDVNIDCNRALIDTALGMDVKLVEPKEL
jgi:hypothetical protein